MGKTNLFGCIENKANKVLFSNLKKSVQSFSVLISSKKIIYSNYCKILPLFINLCTHIIM